MITEDIMIDKMVECGACEGMEKATCLKAIQLIFRTGAEKMSLVKAITGTNFDNFADNYRAAIEKIRAEQNANDVSDENAPVESHKDDHRPFMGEMT